MSEVLILDLGASVKGNCLIDGADFKDKVIVESYSHGVSLPMQGDASQAERTAGRPMFSEMSFSKMSDLSTTEIYKACITGTNIPKATLWVGRVENGVYMGFFKYEFDNAMISNMSTSGGGSLPRDSVSICLTKIKCEFTQQQSNSSKKGTGTWNWNAATMKSD